MKGSVLSDKPEGPFPSISQEEMVAFTTVLTERFSQKFPSLSNQNRILSVVDQLRLLTEKMSSAEQKRAESKQGIVIGSLPAPLQQEFVFVVRAQTHGGNLRPWSRIQPILENLRSLKADVDYWKIQFSGPGKQFEIGTGGGEKPSDAEVTALQERLEKGCTRVVDYAKKTTLQAPPEIQRHFITAAALTDEPEFFAALAKRNGWKYQQESTTRVSLQPTRPNPSDDAMSLLPAEYRRFLQSARGPYSAIGMPFTGTYIRFRGMTLSKDAALYFRLFHKLLGKRDLLDFRTATEPETYALTRMLFSGAAGNLGVVVTNEMVPYVDDYKNAILTTNSTRNEFTVKHPKGGSFSAGQSIQGLISGQ
ncbi:MAG: hypothetical protein QM758_08790 [Armatimonas sp.]